MPNSHPCRTFVPDRLWRQLSVLIAGLALAVGEAAAGGPDWPAWRGGEKQGRMEAAGYPTTWSREQNVLWKTPIPGSGHSSPVVVGGCILLTTAYESRHASAWHTAADHATFAVALLATLAAVPYLLRTSRPGLQGTTSPGGFAGTALFAVTWAVILVLLFFGEKLLDYGRCDIRAWIASCVLATLCLRASTWGTAAASPWQLLLGLCSVLLAFCVVAAIPSREHALRGGPFSANMSVVLFAGSLPLSLGVYLLLSFLRRRAGDRPPLPSSGRVRRLGRALAPAGVAAGSLFVTAAVFLLLAVEQPEAAAAAGTPAVLVSLPWAGAAVGLLLAALLIRRRTGDNRPAGLGLLLGVVLLSVVAGAKLLEWLCGRVPYFAYHLGSPTWRPTLSWWMIGVFLGACAARVAFCLAAWPGMAGGQGRQPPPSFRVLTLLLACGFFAHHNYLRFATDYSRAILCLDNAGRLQWRCEGLRGSQGPLDRRNSPATPTPAAAGGRIVAYFGTPGLMCCDLEGRLLWVNRDLPCESAYGAASSPVISGETVVLVCDSPRGTPRAWALSCADGRPLWSRALPADGALSGNNRTPEIKDVGGRRVVLVWTGSHLFALDLLTGYPCWQLPFQADGDVVTSSVSDESTLYLTGKRGTRALSLEKLSQGRDPLLWHNKRVGANCSSPVLVKDCLFLVTEYGVAACLDARSGKTLWRERLGGQYCASVLADEQSVYFTNNQGRTAVFACEGIARRIATNELEEETYASFAASAGRIYARTLTHLVCLAREEE